MVVPALDGTVGAALTAVHEFTGLVPMAPAMPKVTAQAPWGANRFEVLLGWAKWVSLAVCVIGLMMAGAVMAFQSRRGEGSEHLHRVGMALVGVVIITAASSLVSMLA
ncbi:hypothetical protein GCM10011575_44210 [Microlunatus endophyticus]|uniref:TrbC/VIRB2 family protein n=1 Tax=Microlunatus endophyticus TaxID=1716077 RepID=A0A917SGF9_9ACTN|nr:hypothetical protein [Microlunatus endophyticus]GGL81026.1 hypothetical protein GCM10011575_44210 [Microlunatus endophyticus]